MNVTKNYFEQLKIQKIIPIINSKNFNDDVKKIESIITNNKDIKLIEITLRESESYQNAIKLVEYFPKIKFGLGSILKLETYNTIDKQKFNFFVSPSTIKEIVSIALSFLHPSFKVAGKNLITLYPKLYK